MRHELPPRLRNSMESVNLEHIREATMGDDEFLAELITCFSTTPRHNWRLSERLLARAMPRGRPRPRTP